jgi:hypothetical protein
MGAIVWEKAPDEDVLGDCVLAIRPASWPVDGLSSTGPGGRIGEDRDRQAAAQGARVVPVPRRPRTAATASRWLSPEPVSNA